MRTLYLRIYLTVVAALALFAGVSGWLVQRHVAQEREHFVASAQERANAWAELLQRALPGADAPVAEQAAALADWSERLRLPLALDDAQGRRIGASDSFRAESGDIGAAPRRTAAVALADGRVLWIQRPLLRRGPQDGGPGARAGGPPGTMAGPMSGPMAGPGGALMHHGAGGGMARGFGTPPPDDPPLRGWPLPWLPGGLGLAALLLVLLLAVAAGAWPVVRRLTRRLEALKRGVEAFGDGQLQQRVSEDGRDEVAALAASFNRAAARIEALLRSHQSLLANASHELRSPLARLKMAVAMLDEAPPAQRERLRGEIHANIGELDALVEEVLLASRLDAGAAEPAHEPVELLALAAEEGARFDAAVDGETVELRGSERLLRRALRNLLENARRYGGGEVALGVRRAGDRAELRVCDRGPGVPEAFRERIFEPFFRLPGHAEREGGIGLGLALVRQIARTHGGDVRCEPRPGGGSCFVLGLPVGPTPGERAASPRPDSLGA
jgi:signal transduction histidine kinase